MSRIFNQKNLDVSASDGYVGSVNAYRILEVLDQWHEAQCADRGLLGNNENFDAREEKHAHIGGRYIRLDVGGSGAWMLDTNGDIFGIHGYGKVNRVKCAGNINDPDFNGAVLFKDRFRYGRFDNRKVVVS